MAQCRKDAITSHSFHWSRRWKSHPSLPWLLPSLQVDGEDVGSPGPPSLSLLQHHANHDGGGGNDDGEKNMIRTSSSGSLCQLAGELLHPEDVFPPLPIFSFSISLKAISLKAVVHIEYAYWHVFLPCVCVCVYVRYTHYDHGFQEVICLDKILWFTFPHITWGCFGDATSAFSTPAPLKVPGNLKDPKILWKSLGVDFTLKIWKNCKRTLKFEWPIMHCMPCFFVSFGPDGTNLLLPSLQEQFFTAWSRVDTHCDKCAKMQRNRMFSAASEICKRKDKIWPELKENLQIQERQEIYNQGEPCQSSNFSFCFVI